MPINVTLCVLIDSLEWIFGTYNVLTWLGLLLLCMIFYLCSYSDFILFLLSNLFNYQFPYCIHLYTWSTQQVIGAHHMCWFRKAPNPPMFSTKIHSKLSSKTYLFTINYYINSLKRMWLYLKLNNYQEQLFIKLLMKTTSILI